MGGGGADRSACTSGQCARAASKILNEISKYIDRNFRSTVTVAYIIIDIYIQRKCRVEVTSVGLAHARPITYIYILVEHCGGEP